LKVITAIMDGFVPLFASPMNQGSWYTRKSLLLFTAPFAARRIHRTRRMADLLHNDVVGLAAANTNSRYPD
jgi:hypothetical protein